jgi:cytochrome c2
MPNVTLKIIRLLPLAALLVLFGVGLGGCSKPVAADNGVPVTGDAAAGAALIIKLGCGSCHAIPGIVDAGGMVGPPLDHMARRQFIAGMLRNTPDNMVHWLRFPQQVVPGNAMPDLGIDDHDARQLTAYLATLK